MADNENNRSSLWSIGAVGALTTGIGYGIYKNKNSFIRALQSSENILEKTTSRLQDISRFSQTKSAYVGEITPHFESMLSGYEQTATSKVLVSDIKEIAFQSLLSSGKFNQKEALDIVSNIGEQKSALDAYRLARESILSNLGDVSLLEREVQGLGTGLNYNEYRLSNFLNTQDRIKTAISPGGYGLFGSESNRVSLDRISKEAREYFRTLREKININTDYNLNISWELAKISERIGGKTITTPIARMKIGNQIGINIPLENTGYIYGGEYLTSRYVTRKAYGADASIIGSREYYEKMISDAIGTSGTETELRENLHKAHQALISSMNERDMEARSAAIWTLPEQISPSGTLAKNRLFQAEAVPFRDLSETEIENVLGRGLYPYTSPSSAAKGVLTTENLSESIFGPLGRWVGAEERPTQFVRSGWGVTEEAKQIALAKPFRGEFGKYYSRLDRKIKGEGYERLIYGGKSVVSAQAYSSPQLVAFYAKTRKGKGFESDALNKRLALEEGVISESVLDMLEHERIVQKKITLEEGLRINKDLLESLYNRPRGPDSLVSFEKPLHGYMGREIETGKEIWAETLRGGAVGAELVGENVANIYMRETIKPSNSELIKMFSEENKFVFSPTKSMWSYLEDANARSIEDITGQKIEAMLSGELVGRNKMALYNQQMEAISIILSRKLKSPDKQFETRLGRRFLRSPTRYLGREFGGFKNLMEDGELAVQEKLIQTAKSFGFNPEEMQYTFGLADENILSKLQERKILTAEDVGNIMESPGVIGLTKGRMGDILSEGGAGTRGSLEQTGFRALSMKGEEGQLVAAEFAQRIQGKGELSAADRMLLSAVNQDKSLIDKTKEFFLGQESIPNIKDISVDQLIQNKGRYVNLGRGFKELGGSSRIYIPGINEAESIMSPYVTIEGQRIDSPLVKSLKNLKYQIDKNFSEEELEKAAMAFRNAAAAVSEEQVAARGKIFGSKLLHGIQRGMEGNAFGISERTATSMFEDLAERATSQEQRSEILAQLESLKQGNIGYGAIWRHPTTGPESIQFAPFAISNVPEGTIAIPSKRGLLNIGDKTKEIDISSTVGMAGDFDKDQYVIAAITNRDARKRVEKSYTNLNFGNLGTTESEQKYNSYLFRHYAMKEAIDERKIKESIATMGEKEALVMGRRRLVSPKITTGRVNTALQKLKIAVQANAPQEYRPMSELFWHLEQAAIGGKHGVLGQKVYSDIVESVKYKDAEKLGGVIESLLGPARTISGSIESEGKLFPQVMEFNPKEMGRVAIDALSASESDINIAMRSARVAKNSIENLGLEQVQEMVNARSRGSIDVAQRLLQESYGETDKFARTVGGSLSKLQTKASGLVNAFKSARTPMLIGSAVAAGLLLFAPSKAGELRGVSTSGEKLSKDDVIPYGGEGMDPPPPGMQASPRTYDNSREKQSIRANIRIRTNDGSNRDAGKAARELSRSGKVNIITRDDREALDSRMLANRISERL